MLIITRARLLTVLALLFLTISLNTTALEKVNIQLKWQHGFQFAGYYAAIEKGFYQEEGLDVELKALDYNKNPVTQVIQGESEYGISDAMLLIEHLRGKPVVLVAQIFQRTPLVFLSRADSGILSPKDFSEKTIAVRDSNVESLLMSLLAANNTITDNINKISFDLGTYQNFIEGKIDVISGYISSQPYLLKQRGIEVNIINPQGYGIDIYGDNLFTTQNEIKNRPDRVKKMRRATLKGWQYALKHPNEIINIIIEKYNPLHTKAYLEYESFYIRQVIVPELIDIGSINRGRLQRAADIFMSANQVPTNSINNKFIYQVKKSTDPQNQLPLTRQEKNWIKSHPVVVASATPDWPPFDFVNSQGKATGLLTEYLELIANKTGLELDIQVDTWSNNLKKIKSGEIDIITGITADEERSKYLTFTDPVTSFFQYFFIRNDLNVKSIKDLDGMRVAIPRGFIHIKKIKKNFPRIKIIEVDTLGDAIDRVLEGKAELLYDTYSVLRFSLQEEGIMSIVPFKSTRVLGMQTSGFAVNKKNPVLAAIIQKAISSISDTEKKRIMQKWIDYLPKSQRLMLSITEIDWITSNPKIYYGAERDWIPFDFVSDNDNHAGITRDYLDLINQVTGIEFIPVIDNWNNLLKKLDSGEISLLPAMHKDEERAKKYAFTNSYMAAIPYFFKRDNIIAHKLSDLDGKVIAIPRGYAFANIVRKQYPKIKILETRTLNEAIDAVLHKKADLLIESHSAIRYIFNKKGITNIHSFAPLNQGKSYDIHMAAKKSDTILITILEKALANISLADKQAVLNKWLGTRPEELALRLNLSSEEWKWLDKHRSIRFAGDPDWLPYEAINSNNEYIGIVADYLKLIERYININFVVSPTNTKDETIEKAINGEVDVISVTDNAQLKTELSFSQSYLHSPIVILMNDKQQYVDTIESIQHKKIGLVKTYGYSNRIKASYPDIDFIDVNNVQDGLTAVSTGKLDAFLCTLSTATFQLSDMHLNNVRIVGKTEFSNDLAFAVTSEFKPLISILNKTLNAIDPTEKQQILRNWGNERFTTKTDYRLLIKLALVFLAAILLFWFWNRRLAKEVYKRKQSEANLEMINNRFSLAAEAVSLGVWELTKQHPDSTDIKLSFDQKMQDIYEFSNDQVSWQNWLGKIHPDDRLSFKKHITKILSKGGKTHLEFRILTDDKQEKFIYAGASSEKDIKQHKNTKLVGVNWDITRIKRTEKALHEARLQAEKANRAKSEFLANMSHEIRTPMNAILGFTELLHEQLTDARLQSFVKTIRSAGSSLLALINDILDLSKIEAGKLKIQKSACNPHELFTELGNIFMMRVKEKNLDLLMEIDEKIPESLILDQVRLRQILFNLIGNAVKFTETGFIRIAAKAINADEIRSRVDLLIEVQDSGIGIAADQQDLVFEQFEQTENHDVRKFGGTGLGLSISTRLATMMGGQLSMDSKLGEGSTFRLLLEGVDVSAVTPAEKQKDQPPVKFVFKPANLLVVDDVEDNRALLIANFADTKINVQVAENGQQAVDLAKQEEFDLILMDIRMPVMDGYEASTIIKTFCQTPIIALTASVMMDEFERVKSKAFDSYLRKPVLKTDLFAEISRFLEHDIQQYDNKTLDTKLSEQELKHAEVAAKTLREIQQRFQDLQTSNNISDLQLFAKELQALNKAQPIKTLAQYISQLNQDLDSFNIIGIKAAVSAFPTLIANLEQQLAARENH